MIVRDSGSRYSSYRKFDNNDIAANSMKYNYDENGLLPRLMSSVIINSKNVLVYAMRLIFEESLKLTSHYIDELKNFKNFTSKNR